MGAGAVPAQKIARIQTFPDEYEFVYSRVSDGYKMIGNAVPPEMAKNIALAISKTLKKRGFKFVGSTVIYAFMQAVGMVNDHEVSCFRHQECRELARDFPEIIV